MSCSSACATCRRTRSSSRPGFFVDGNGRAFVPREAARLVAAASAAPVYGPFSTHVGTGIVGGRTTSFDAIGQRRRRDRLALLEGAAPASLALPAVMPTALHVDWRQLRRWGIDPQTLPADAVVQFRTPSFWESYGRWVLFGRRGRAAAGRIHRRADGRAPAPAAHGGRARPERAAHEPGRSRGRTVDVGAGRRYASAAGARTLTERADGGPCALSTSPARSSASTRPTATGWRRHSRRARVRRDFDVEYRVVGTDGTLRWQSARGRADHGQGQRLLGVVSDITQRKQAEAEAAQAHAALQHMTRVTLLGQLSASIAHQLNQPLASILGNAEAAQKLLQREPVDVAELRDICADIVAEDHRAAEVIRRLGALFRRRRRRSRRSTSTSSCATRSSSRARTC